MALATRKVLVPSNELTEVSDGASDNVLLQVITAVPVEIFVAADDADISSTDIGHQLKHVSVPSMSLGDMIASGMKVYARARDPQNRDGQLIVTEY